MRRRATRCFGAGAAGMAAWPAPRASLDSVPFRLVLFPPPQDGHRPSPPPKLRSLILARAWMASLPAHPARRARCFLFSQDFFSLLDQDLTAAQFGGLGTVTDPERRPLVLHSAVWR